MENIRDLFKKYVDGDRAFDENKVVIVEGDDSPYSTVRARYKHKGVRIEYFSRITWQRDDYDRFTDYKVVVDGVVKVDERMQ